MERIDSLVLADPEAAFDVDSWPGSAEATAIWERVEQRIPSSGLDPIRRRSRFWVAAVAAVALIGAALVLPALLTSGAPPDVADSTVLRLGHDGVWPATPVAESPADLASDFASQVLGWEQSTINVPAGSDARGPVWVTVDEPLTGASVEVLTAPASGSSRTIFQIGSPPFVTDVMSGVAGVARIHLLSATTPASAVVTVQLASGNQLEIEVGSAEFQNGYVDATVGGAENIAAILVLFRDDQGTVIDAAGGTYRGDS